VICPAVALVAVLLGAGLYLESRGATAQTPEAGGDEASSELNLTRWCGLERRLLVRAWETGGSTNNAAAFVTVPPMNLGLGTVAASTSACIIVHYSAEIQTGNNFCYFRALYNGVEMSPQGGGFRSGASLDNSTETHTLMWVHVPPATGAGVVTIQYRSSVAGQFCTVDDQFLSISIRG
jgi:hypothetical protein